jgi:hypothetical protein
MLLTGVELLQNMVLRHVMFFVIVMYFSSVRFLMVMMQRTMRLLMVTI